MTAARALYLYASAQLVVIVAMRIAGLLEWGVALFCGALTAVAWIEAGERLRLEDEWTRNN